MNIDSYFEIGHSHRVCEDYALSGVHQDLGYAIVSDGCSSSKNCDVGARLLSHIAKDALLYLHQRKLLYDIHFFYESFLDTFKEMVVKKSLEVRDTLKLPYDVFDTTLLLAFGTDQLRYLLAWGDGYFIVKRKSHEIIYHISYESGAPYYLSYEMSEDKKEAYRLEFSSSPCTVTVSPSGADEGGELPFNMRHSLVRKFIGTSVEDIQQIILCSDGIGTYQNLSNGSQDIPVEEILPDIIGYKNPVGEFVTRRMNALRRDHLKRGIVHQDDVSCAAIDFS
jgi:hypothetical protein